MTTYNRDYYIKNKERILAKNKRWSDENPHVGHARSKRWRLENPERNKAKSLEWQVMMKGKIFEKLGWACAHCGFSDRRALCVDHINGDGYKDRKTLSKSVYYRKVIEDKLGLYQILCCNCNQIKKLVNKE